MNLHISIEALALFPIVLIGFVLPWINGTYRGLLFGVTVPLNFAASPTALASLRRYRYRTLAVAVSIALLYLVMLAMNAEAHLRIAPAIVVPLELLAAFMFWQRERRIALAHAIVVPLERTADLTPSHRLGLLMATASAAIPVLATGLWLHLHWARIPNRWPRHWDMAGTANGFTTRSTASVYAACVTGLFMVLTFTVYAAFLGNASGPQSSQRNRTLVPMAGVAWLIAGESCWVALLPLRPNLTPWATALAVVLYTAAFLGVVFWLLRSTGFLKPPTQTEAYDGTPDARWYGGIIYYNPADAALLVPKRYGWGWTLNFARPAAWVFTALLVGFVAISAWLPRLLR